MVFVNLSVETLNEAPQIRSTDNMTQPSCQETEILSLGNTEGKTQRKSTDTLMYTAARYDVPSMPWPQLISIAVTFYNHDTDTCRLQFTVLALE